MLTGKVLCLTWRIVKLTSPQLLCEWWEKCTVVSSLSTGVSGHRPEPIKKPKSWTPIYNIITILTGTLNAFAH